LGALATAALAGCKGKIESLGSSKRLIELQDRAWNVARQAMKADPPDLGCFAAVAATLGVEARPRLQEEYDRGNKAEVLAKLDHIRSRFDAELAPLLAFTPKAVLPRYGVPVSQIRTVFGQLDQEYRQFEGMLK
jgi:hypothetical protein